MYKRQFQSLDTPPNAAHVPYSFFLMIRRPPRSTRKESSAASDVYKRQGIKFGVVGNKRKALWDIKNNELKHANEIMDKLTAKPSE